MSPTKKPAWRRPPQLGVYRILPRASWESSRPGGSVYTPVIGLCASWDVRFTGGQPSPVHRHSPVIVGVRRSDQKSVLGEQSTQMSDGPQLSQQLVSVIPQQLTVRCRPPRNSQSSEIAPISRRGVLSPQDSGPNHDSPITGGWGRPRERDGLVMTRGLSGAALGADAATAGPSARRQTESVTLEESPSSLVIPHRPPPTAADLWSLVAVVMGRSMTSSDPVQSRMFPPGSHPSVYPAVDQTYLQWAPDVPAPAGCCQIPHARAVLPGCTQQGEQLFIAAGCGSCLTRRCENWELQQGRTSAATFSASV